LRELTHLKTLGIEGLTKIVLVNMGGKKSVLCPVFKRLRNIISALQAKDNKHHDMVQLMMNALEGAVRFLPITTKDCLEEEVVNLVEHTPYEAAYIPFLYSLINLIYSIFEANTTEGECPE
jgi:hypothetical protein